MTGFLTTHVLDTARGCPAAGLRIDLYQIKGNARLHLTQVETNEDGRTDAPMLGIEHFVCGEYELVFHAGPYFAARSKSAFLDLIPVRFHMDMADHYHVPLLLSDYGYSTYRGS